MCETEIFGPCLVRKLKWLRPWYNPQLHTFVSFCQFIKSLHHRGFLDTFNWSAKLSFSRVDPGHISYVLIISDFQPSFSKIRWIEVIAVNWPFLVFWGHFEFASVPIKHEQELPQHQTSWFYKDLIQLVTKLKKNLMDANLVNKQKV